MIDVDDDLVELAIEKEVAAGRVVEGYVAGLVRLYLADYPAAAAEFGLQSDS